MRMLGFFYKFLSYWL